MADVRTITREDLKAKMDRGEDLVLLEVLGEGSYRQGHLPGAIRAQDQNAAMEVVPDRSAFVVAYCSNYNWHASTRVARALAAEGYENVYDYEGGKQDWVEAGLPTESEWAGFRRFVGEGSGEHRTRSVSFEGEEDRLAGFFALPEGEGPFPGVVVIHEAFGLNENIRDVARRFAAHGYAAFAVDLFAGRNRAVCTARFMGGMLRGKPRPFGVVGDLERALSVLGEQPGVDAERLGAIGFCMGGGYALAWACNDDGLKAIAPYYDANPRPLAAVARSCLVVGSYPEKDFTALSARKLDAELARHHIPHDVKIYPGARHSFFNDRGRAYDPAAAEDSWRRTLAFFAEHIR